MTDETVIHDLITRWAGAVRAGDLDGVLDAHADDVVMFDVPEDGQVVRGIDAYGETWPPFFGYLHGGAAFDVLSVDVTAGSDVAFAVALLRCGTPEELAAYPDRLLRLTVGLRRDHGRWVVAHEHHSFASPPDE